MKIKKIPPFTKKEDLIKLYDQLSATLDMLVKYSQYDAAIEVADSIYYVLNKLLEREDEDGTAIVIPPQPSRRAKPASKKPRYPMPENQKRAICENFRDKQESAANGI